MLTDDNVKCWVDCWKASMPKSDLISDEIQAHRWNRRAGTFAKNIDDERQQKKSAGFLNFLQEAGFSPEGAKVLDIGCGPGSLSIPLAKAGATVTSLDISSEMLNRLLKTAKEEHLDITPVECSWWTADIDALGFRNSFDLVLASMTPGIRDVETFDRMMACSKKFCYYSNFIQSQPEKIPTEIYVKILGKVPKRDMFAAGFIYPFMYLYTRGFHPRVKIYHKSIKREQNWIDAAEKAIDFLQLDHDLNAESREKIREYYENLSLNGQYKADYEMYSGMMIWSVDKDMPPV